MNLIQSKNEDNVNNLKTEEELIELDDKNDTLSNGNYMRKVDFGKVREESK